MRTHVEFRSSKFPAYPGEEEEINPNLWGKRLAEYLLERLPTKGILVEDIGMEDWGCMVSLKHEEFPMWIGCAHYEEYPDGYLVFVEPSKPIVKKGLFKKIDATPDITKIANALDEILNVDPEIHDLRWWDENER